MKSYISASKIEDFLKLKQEMEVIVLKLENVLLKIKLCSIEMKGVK